MYTSFNGIYRFFELKDGKEYECPFIEGYSDYILKTNTLGTLVTYISPIHKFWLYSLYFPNNTNETFKNYMWKYYEVIATKGFIIRKTDSVLNVKINYKYKEYMPTNSGKSDMIALSSYFNYIFDELNNEKFDLVDNIPFGMYGDAFNYQKIDNAKKYNKGSSYGLKARGIMRDTLANNITIFDKLIKSKKYDKRENSLEKKLSRTFKNINQETKLVMKNFPSHIFNDFLYSVKNPRDKLLYLLCAGTGCRRSQALNLTFYDVDAIQQKVYLTDPFTNQVPVDSLGNIFMNQLGRKDLLMKYNISSKTKPHSKIGFKYPIPVLSENNRELLFLPGKYKQKFFDIFSEVLETIDIRQDPFIFKTRTGKRYLPSEASRMFEYNLNKFLETSPIYQNLIIENGLHSLRHMYAVIWADIAFQVDNIIRKKYIDGETKGLNAISVFKIFIAAKMGIKSSAIDVYYENSEYIRTKTEFLMQELGETFMLLFDIALDYIKNSKINLN